MNAEQLPIDSMAEDDDEDRGSSDDDGDIDLDSVESVAKNDLR